MQLLLVRWPERRRKPPGTIGLVQIIPAGKVYAAVHDREAFEEWAHETGVLADCGHVPAGVETLAKTRAVRDGKTVPGLRLHTDGVVRMRVWPIGIRPVDTLAKFLWTSPVLDGRRGGKRRRRWRV